MMKSPKKQRGLSLISTLLVLAFLGVVATLAVRLVPVYLQYYNVRSVMNELAHLPNVGSMGFQQICNNLTNRFTINNINAVSCKDLKMTTVGNETTLSVKYQVKQHLIANIDGLFYFSYAVHYPAKNNSAQTYP